MKTIIADITRANPGTEPRLLQTVRSVYGAADIHLVCYQHQLPMVSQIAGMRYEVMRTDANHNDIVREIQQKFVGPFVSKQPVLSEQMIVLSFHPAVLSLESFVPVNLKGQLEFMKWTRLFGPVSATAMTSTHESPVDLTKLMPDDEILRFLKAVLDKAKAYNPGSAIRASELRHLIAYEDERFAKANPHANASGTVKAILRLAIQHDLIVMDASRDRVNPPIWLKTLNAPSDTSPNDSGQASIPKLELASSVTPAAPSPVHSVPASSQADPTNVTLSDRFLDSLEKQGMGPFSTVRESVYDNLGSLLSSTGEAEKQKLGTLLLRAQEKSRADLVSRKVVGKEYPWRGVHAFLRKILIRRPVFLDEKGNPIQPKTFESLYSTVASAIPNWRIELEGELLLALVESGIEVKLDDLFSLSGALYYDRSESSVEKTNSAVEFMLRTGRLQEDGTGRLVLVSNMTSRIIPIPQSQ